MELDIYAQNWEVAKKQAEANGLQIIEHGWEQHVIIDELLRIVYRYPRHKAAADKLADEVLVLQSIHKSEWLIKLPVMVEHTDIFTAYNLIVGDVLDISLITTLSDQSLTSIGSELGAFLAQLHRFDPTPVQNKKTKQTTTLYEYYETHIRGARNTKFYHPAHAALSKLSAGLHSLETVVVHGDLHGLNVVVDRNHDHVTGVIDLSEMEIGDPHQDFRKLFMTDSRLLHPAVSAYHKNGGQRLDEQTIKLWAYLNEWANLCHYADKPENLTFQRALMHLRKWNQM